MTTEQGPTSKPDKNITKGGSLVCQREEDDKDKQEVETAVERLGVLTCVCILKPRTGASQEIRGRWERNIQSRNLNLLQ